MQQTGAERLYTVVKNTTDYPDNLEDMVQRFLAQPRITDRKRTIYHLWFDEQLSLSEIANDYGYPQPNTSTTIRELKMMFANYLRKSKKGTPLDDLQGITGRIYGILERAGYSTIEQLSDEIVTYGTSRLLSVDGLGAKNIEMISDALAEYKASAITA